MKQFYSTESIYWDLLYLRNGAPQTGKTLPYEIFNESRSVVSSGNLTEGGSSGIYHFTWAGHGYTSLTRLNVKVKENNRYIVDDDIIILPSSANNPDIAAILAAIESADKYADGSAR
jgi:hypothetical protein